MPILEHPEPGTILTCNFDAGFKVPEMVKRRPVVVISPKIRARPSLCTIVALSSKPPNPIMPYHCKLELAPPLPEPWLGLETWVKGDMVMAVGFHRLDLIRTGKDMTGKRVYRYAPVSEEQFLEIRRCVLRALGMATLTKHL